MTATSATPSSGLRYDILVRNGSVVDGSGRPAFGADVGLRGDRIVALGALEEAQASKEIDAEGLIVAPGFIDVHTHDDAALIARPGMAPKLTQGVTTVIGGNCGISGAPYGAAGDPPGLLRLVFKSERFMAATFDEYARRIGEARPALNVGFLTGHATLRIEVMGEGNLDRCASRSEAAAMRELLAQCLEAGSLGLSTGLFYAAARAASTREVIEVAQPLGDYQGLYVTHLRDEADGIMASLEEAFEIGRTAAARVVISHHKCMGRRNFGRSEHTLKLIQQRSRSQAISLDVYPYTAASTVLMEELVEKSVRTLVTWCDPHPEFCGRDIADVAQALGCSPAEAVPKLLPAGAVYFLMDEADVQRIMQFPKTMIGSDGLPEDKHPHPRLWGTFPRVLGRYVRERSALTLEEAVHRMTGLSAREFGLEGRGQVAVGHYADLCLFDPRTVLDTATFENPEQASAGIRHVLVNGQLALENGVLTPARAGRVLRRS